MLYRSLALILLLSAARTAAADPDQGGLSVSAGAGVVGFTSHDMRAATAVGGAWDVRAVYGTHAILAVEGAYTGSVQAIAGTTRSSALVGNACEIAARANLASGAWQPFAFFGAGVERYDVTRSFTVATQGMNDHDTVFEMPFGGGVTYRWSNMAAEVRGTVRVVTAQDLMPLTPGTAAPMHSWGATATIGRAF